MVGWCADRCGHAAMSITPLFVIAAFLHFGKLQAGCRVGVDDDEALQGDDDAAVCDKKVYGMQPAAMVGVVITVITVVSAITMPIVAATIDHTP